MTHKIFIISLLLLGLVQFSFGQKTVSPAKKKLVSELITKTGSIFPTDVFENLFKNVQTEKLDKTEKDLAEMFYAEVDKTGTMTTEEKTAAKSKVPEFSKKLSQLFEEIMVKDFSVRSWVNDAFQKHYSNKFTVAELRQLNAYFQTENGKNTVQLFNQMIVGGINRDQTEPDEKTTMRMANFLKTPVGQKFFNVLLENIFAEISAKTDDWGQKMTRDIEKSMENGKMRRLFEEFVAANIKL